MGKKKGKKGGRKAKKAEAAAASKKGNSTTSNSSGNASTTGGGDSSFDGSERTYTPEEIKNQQNLPKQESKLFKTVLDYHENRSYRKALKAADNVLRRYPLNGNTLAMKALSLRQADKANAEQAFTLVRKALKYHPTSHLPWLVCGNLHKMDKDYSAALRYFKQARKIQPESSIIFRNLNVCHMQLRDYNGYVDSRFIQLGVQNRNPEAWMGCAMALCLNKHFDLALRLLEYQRSMNKWKKWEASRVALFENNIVFCKGIHDAKMKETTNEEEKNDGGDGVTTSTALNLMTKGYRSTLEHLEATSNKIMDRQTYEERRGQLLLLLSEWDDAFECYDALVTRNAEHYGYHRGLQSSILKRSLGTCTDDQTIDENLAMLSASLAGCQLPVSSLKASEEQYLPKIKDYYNKKRLESNALGRSRALKRIPLEFLQGNEFKQGLDAYLKEGLRKGVPSLFNLVKQLYITKKPENLMASTMEDILSGYLENLEKYGSFATNGDGTNALPPAEAIESPTVLLWTFLVYAQHNDLIGKTMRALEYVDKAIAHTPTMMDLYESKAQILANAGNFIESARVYDSARSMDLADRYINTLSVQSFFKIGNLARADHNAAMFTRYEGDPKIQMVDMQVSWYSLAAGKCHLNAGRKGMALKYFRQVESFFDQWVDDQIDFHSYCLRKLTLGVYLDMLRIEDQRIKANAFYQEAALAIAQLYLDFHTDFEAERKARKFVMPSESELAKLNSGERKKLKNRIRLQKKKEDDRRNAARKDLELQMKSLTIEGDGFGESSTNGLGSNAGATSTNSDGADSVNEKANESSPQGQGEKNGAGNSTAPVQSTKQAIDPKKVDTDPLGENYLELLRQEHEKSVGDSSSAIPALVLKAWKTIEAFTAYFANGGVPKSQQIKAHLLAYDIASRMRNNKAKKVTPGDNDSVNGKASGNLRLKIGLMGRSLVRAAKVNQDAPELLGKVLEFVNTLQEQESKYNGEENSKEILFKGVVSSFLSSLNDKTTGTDLSSFDSRKYLDEWTQRNSQKSLAHCLACADAYLVFFSDSNRAAQAKTNTEKNGVNSFFGGLHKETKLNVVLSFIEKLQSAPKNEDEQKMISLIQGSSIFPWVKETLQVCYPIAPGIKKIL
eukprot:g3823.t1